MTFRTDLARVTEEVVRAEPRPEFTETWHPFSHAEILDAMGMAVEQSSLTVVNKEYSIRQNSKMFAAWELETKEKEFNFGIGIMNSIDKTHSVWLTCFQKIFTCSNFVFRIEHHRIVFRKHTGQLELVEIVYLAKEAITRLIPKFQELKRWHVEMKGIELDSRQSSLLTIAAMKRDLIPPAKFQLFDELYQGSATKYLPTLHGWHGAATELMNSNNLLTITWKQDRLNYFIDYEARLLLSSVKGAIIDFKAIEKTGFEKYQIERVARKEETKKIAAEIKESFKESKKKPKEEKKAQVVIDKKKLEKEGKITAKCGLTVKLEETTKKEKVEEKKPAKTKAKEEKKVEVKSVTMSRKKLKRLLEEKPAKTEAKEEKKVEAEKKPESKTLLGGKLIFDSPDYHDDFQKSIDFLAKNRVKAGKIYKVIIVRRKQGFVTEFYGAKYWLTTYGFKCGDSSKNSRAIHDLLKINLKLGDFTSIYMIKLKVDHGLTFTKGKVAQF